MPNGSRLSCGRNARGRKAVDRQKQRLARRANATLPYLCAPGSFMRWLGGAVIARRKVGCVMCVRAAQNHGRTQEAESSCNQDSIAMSK